MKIKRHIGTGHDLKNALVFTKAGNLLAVVVFTKRLPNDCFEITVLGAGKFKQSARYQGALGHWMKPAHPQLADHFIQFRPAPPKERWAGQVEISVQAHESVTVHRAETEEGKQWLNKLK